MDCSLPGSSVHGIVQEGIGSGLPCPPPGDLPDPGNEFKSPALAGRLFTTESPQKPWLRSLSEKWGRKCTIWRTFTGCLCALSPGNPGVNTAVTLALSSSWEGVVVTLQAALGMEGAGDPLFRVTWSTWCMVFFILIKNISVALV